MENKLNVALIVGGTSPERPVSKSSGKAIYKALNNLGYSVKIIDPAYGENQPEDIEQFFSETDFAELKNENYIKSLNSETLKNIDIAFLALHGKWGEDGTVQSILDLLGVKYTGSGVLASSLAMDKNMTKVMFRHFDVATANWFVVEKNENDFELIKEKIEKFFGYPCVVKPNDQGSTFGLTICNSKDEVEKAVKFALEFSDKALVEKFIPGREVTVAVIEHEALPVLEIKPKHDHYDYECKYTKGMSQYIVPADIPGKIFHHLQHQALLAFQSVGCKGYARVDFRLTEDYKNYCLEVNTLPGMTDTSLVPKMAKAIGINFEQLIEKIIQISLK